MRKRLKIRRRGRYGAIKMVLQKSGCSAGIARGRKKQRLKVHTKCSETWKNGFELRKRRKYTIKTSQNRVAKINFRTKTAMNSLRKRTDCNI